MLYSFQEVDLHTLKNTRGARRILALTRPGSSHFPFRSNFSPLSVIPDDPPGECMPVGIISQFRRRNLGEEYATAISKGVPRKKWIRSFSQMANRKKVPVKLSCAPEVGPAPVYLGDHWATDVIGGYLFGGVAWPLASAVSQRTRKRRIEW